MVRMGNGTVRIIRRRPFCATPSSQSALKQAEGFTLIELMLAVTIVGVLASLAVPNYLDFVEKSRVAKTISELHGLTKEIKGFALRAEQYPNSLADIGRSTMLDPWGTPYQYSVVSQRFCRHGMKHVNWLAVRSFSTWCRLRSCTEIHI